MSPVGRCNVGYDGEVYQMFQHDPLHASIGMNARGRDRVMRIWQGLALAESCQTRQHGAGLQVHGWEIAYACESVTARSTS